MHWNWGKRSGHLCTWTWQYRTLSSQYICHDGCLSLVIASLANNLLICLMTVTQGCAVYPAPRGTVMLNTTGITGRHLIRSIHSRKRKAEQRVTQNVQRVHALHASFVSSLTRMRRHWFAYAVSAPHVPRPGKAHLSEPHWKRPVNLTCV